ncbi:MAG: hypothetical protein J5851_07710 [Oscillospiraceae bacterium]|nr:hypothetical protein [Oscillospiraceae bacterium]
MMLRSLSELIWQEDGFEVRLRCENAFDDEAYAFVRKAAHAAWTPAV